MKANITITATPHINESVRICTLREALDPVIVELLAPEMKNFSHASYKHGYDTGGFGDIEHRVSLGSMEGRWHHWLLSKQPHISDPQVEENWLINDHVIDGKVARPHWNHNNSGELVFGNTVPLSLNGCNKIRIRTNTDGSLKVTRIEVKFPAWESGRLETRDFVEVAGFREVLEDMSPADMLEQGYAGTWTAIDDNWNVYKPHGGLVCPYWINTDFPPNVMPSFLPADYLLL